MWGTKRWGGGVEVGVVAARDIGEEEGRDGGKGGSKGDGVDAVEGLGGGGAGEVVVDDGG
jgi:hypothetical protein